MEYLGYLIAIVIGTIMGIIGGGGSILCVPVFAYIFGIDAVAATTFSLFVVGLTSSVGAFGYYKQGNIELSTALIFGIPSIISVILVRKLLLPNIPDILFSFGEIIFTKNLSLLLLFAILMLISSSKMIFSKGIKTVASSKPNYMRLVFNGFGVGMITGLIGAGGGFLIVPALVMLLGLEMKKAIGTSMLIIAMNSLLGFATSVELVPINWKFLFLFSSLSIVGLFIGIRISKNLDSTKLKPTFGWFVLLVGVYIIIKELVF